MQEMSWVNQCHFDHSLMGSLMETYKDREESVMGWQAGDYCAALCSQNGAWYRAKILALKDDKLVEVCGL